MHVPRFEIFEPPDAENWIASDIYYPDPEFVRQQVYESLKRILRAMADEAGHTPERVCRWYDEAYRSKGASAIRIGMAVGALLYMYWDLRDKEQGGLSLKEAELKNQLAGVLVIVAAGGAGDTIVRDSCNLLGHPI